MNQNEANHENPVERVSHHTADIVDLSEQMRREQAANGRRPWGSDRWNDAEMLGPHSPEFDALMELEAQIIVRKPSGNKDAVKEKRGWKAKTKTWREHLDDDLTFHIESNRKEGAGYVFGRSANGERAAENMREVYAIGLDVEPEMPFAEVAKACEASGLAIVLYTSYNFGVESGHAPVDHILKHGPVSKESVQAYLTAKGKLSSQFIDRCELVHKQEDIGGKRQCVWSTPPQQKMRVVVLLDNPVDVSLLHDSPKQGLETYSNKVRGLADMLGVEIDPAAVDPSRVLYIAKHHPERDWHLHVYRGRGVSWDEIPEVEAESRAGTKRAKPMGIPAITTSTGIEVTALYRRYAKRWLLTDMLDCSHAEKKAHSGYMDVVCPFEHEHTSESSETSTRVWDAGEYENSHGLAFVKCLHSCGERYHTVDYIAAWIEDGAIDPDWLEDPSYMLPAPDEPDNFEMLTPLEEFGFSDALTYFRTEGVDACADVIIDQIIAKGGDADYALQRVSEARNVVKRQLDNLEADRTQDPVKAAKNALNAKPPALLGDLHDPRWVNEEGWLQSYSDCSAIYRENGIADDDAAQSSALAVVRREMIRAMEPRFDWVVIDGQAKIAMRQGPGLPIRMWKESTLDKIYRNRWVLYTGDKGAVKSLKPHEIYAGARERRTFVDTCFEPDASLAPPDSYNLWTGFAAEPRQGEWSRMKTHIRDIICDGNEDHYNYFMTYLASLFQRPGVKIPAAIGIVGEQGTGKSKTMDWVRRAIGCAALKVSSGRHLTGNFNAHLDALILLVCEEAFWAGDKAAAGPLKDIVTSETITIEGKFENVVERRNTVNTVFISNNDWIFPTDGEDARRFLALRVSDARKQDAAYFGAIDDEMETGGMEAMVFDLMHWDPAVIGGWDGLRNPPQTNLLREQIGLGLQGPPSRLMDVICAGELSGRLEDGATFHYDLSETEPTVVVASHLKRVINPTGGRGTDAKAANKAIEDLLGEFANSGDTKSTVRFQKSSSDTTPETADHVRTVTIPALNELAHVKARYGV